jgi:hypothetical protein
MFTKTKIVFSAVLILGAASAALAGGPDMDDRIPTSQWTREAHGNPLPWWWNNSTEGRGTFAYVPEVPRPHTKRP